MDSFIDLFNNREKATILWVLILLVFALFKKDIRNSIFGVFKALLQKKILIVLIAMLLYVGLEVLLFYKIQLWDVFPTKGTTFWILGVAFVLLMSVNKASKDQNYLKKILFNNLKLLLILEFIVNLYTFSLFAEMILISILSIVVAIAAFTGNKKEYLPANKVANVILATFGIFILIFTLSNILSDYQSFATPESLRAFLLPPLLTLAYMPFLYFLALYIAYESLFVRLNIFLEKDKILAKFAKRKIFAICRINLWRLNMFMEENTQKLMRLNDRDGILDIIQNFKNSH